MLLKKEKNQFPLQSWHSQKLLPPSLEVHLTCAITLLSQFLHMLIIFVSTSSLKDGTPESDWLSTLF